MDDYISKPIRVEALIQALERGKALEPAAVGAETTAAPPEAYLDPAALNNLRDMAGAPAFLAELIGAFLEDAPQLLANLRQAVGKDDASGVRLAAHSLKSNGADFGATTFAALCQQLEMRGKSGQLEGAGALLAQIEAEFEKVKAALEAVRGDDGI